MLFLKIIWSARRDYLLVINEKKYIEFGYEIMVTAKRCISNYKADLGDFLNYFNSAWAKEYRRAFGKKQAEEFRCGIHITEDEQILVNKYLKFIDRYSNKYDESQVVSIIAEALCVSCDRAREIIALNNISVISGDAENEDESDTILLSLLKKDIFSQNFFDICKQNCSIKLEDISENKKMPRKTDKYWGLMYPEKLINTEN